MNNFKSYETFINEKGKGLWANIRAKRKRGEKPARKGSEAYKKAKKAADDINNESEQHDEMAYGQLENIIDNAKELRKRFESGEVLDPWMHSKIIKAKDYLTSVFDVIDGKDGNLEEVRTSSVS